MAVQFAREGAALVLAALEVCSSSTPPGGRVHGMCGYFAARSVLTRACGHETASARNALRATR